MSSANRRSETRQQILDAAREVFFREDYVGTSVDQIATAAGLSKGAVYRYFESKAELYVLVLAADGKQFFEGAERQVEKASDWPTVDRVRKLWADYVEHWQRHPDAFRIFWAIDNEEVIGELPRELAEKVPDYWKRSLELTKRVLDEGVERGELIPLDTWQAAQTFWTLATSLIEHDNVKGRRKIRGGPFREMYDAAIEVVLRGMLVDPDQSWLPGPNPAVEGSDSEAGGS